MLSSARRNTLPLILSSEAAESLAPRYRSDFVWRFPRRRRFSTIVVLNTSNNDWAVDKLSYETVAVGSVESGVRGVLAHGVVVRLHEDGEIKGLRYLAPERQPAPRPFLACVYGEARCA